MEQLMVVVLFLVISLSFFIASCIVAKNDKQLAKHGEIATAVVTYINVKKVDQAYDMNHSEQYFYEVAFKTHKGDTVVSTLPVGKSHAYMKKHPEGSKIEIRYLPNNPKVIKEVGETSISMIAIILRACGIAMLVPTIAIIVSFLA